MGIGSIIGWAVFGLVAGAIARLLHPGRDPMNWLWTMLLGIGGAVVGGWIGNMVGAQTDQGVWSWLAAIGGAVILLVLYHMITARRILTNGAASNSDYKSAVFRDMARGPRG
jgi:uncharacterized membrane protein YeaQ/YmgE (transglycosylase-associated protein family)